MPCQAIPCHAMPCDTMPCHTTPHHAVPCLSVPCHALPQRAMPCHAMPCHAMPWVCYRRRNQWLRLALASLCRPLTWLARGVHLLVGVAEGCGGWRRHAHPCAVTGHAVPRCSVGVGAAFLRGVLCQKDEKASNFIWGVLWGVRWGVGVRGGLVEVGLRSLRFAGGINVASK